MQPAARLLVSQSVSLFVCPYTIVLVFICLNSQCCFKRHFKTSKHFKLSTHWKTTSKKTLSERTFANISNIYLKWYSLTTCMECAWRMNPCLASARLMEHLLDHKNQVKATVQSFVEGNNCCANNCCANNSVFYRSVISKTTITSSIVGPSKGQLYPAVVTTASSPWSPR